MKNSVKKPECWVRMTFFTQSDAAPNVSVRNYAKLV